MNYRLLAPVLSVSFGLVTLSGVATAQTYSPTGGLITDASGSDVSSGPGSVVNGDGETIIYGDITTGPGYTVIGAPPEPVTTGPAPAPVDTGSAPAPVDGGTAPAESAPVPVAGDVDGDNLPDSAEAQHGTNPNNPDSDGDGAADGDEINIYRTSPTNPDTDGDGLTDGNELFWTRTDPLRWDTDGDGWGDGDEVNTQSTDPLAAGSFPGSGAAAGAPAAGEVAPSTYQGSSTAPVGETAIVTEPVDTVSSNVAPAGSTTAAPGDTTSYGNGYVTAAPGMVESPTVSTTAPPPVTSTTTTTPPSATTGTTAEPAVTATASCADYGTWYDAQVAYENAGGATSSLAGALDPDGNGTACESMQTY